MFKQQPQQFIDITIWCDEVRNNVRDGITVIYVPHTTAGVTINENGDPDVVGDIISLSKTYPVHGEYHHFEAILTLIKASFMGSSCRDNQDGKTCLAPGSQSTFVVTPRLEILCENH